MLTLVDVHLEVEVGKEELPEVEESNIDVSAAYPCSATCIHFHTSGLTS